jgi:thiol:disulfide interchange protein DsbD
LLAEGRTVFVDYTAAWCVTCQFNKRTALNDSQVLQEVANNRVALLRADWTRRDPEVTQALAALGRNGVPTYVVHRPNAAPQLLPELLTAATVRSAIVGP